MEVSVIVPTYNGANKVPAILRALEEQTFTGFEVIVVVDGSTDNTMQVLEQGIYPNACHPFPSKG